MTTLDEMIASYQSGILRSLIHGIFSRGGAMARKTAVVWAAEDTADSLHAQYRAEPAAEVRTRLHALWLVRRGESPTAAAAVGVSRRSVQRWLGWYREGGLVRVRSPRRGGPGKALLPDAGPAGPGGGGGGHGGVPDRAGGAGLD